MQGRDLTTEDTLVTRFSLRTVSHTSEGMAREWIKSHAMRRQLSQNKLNLELLGAVPKGKLGTVRRCPKRDTDPHPTYKLNQSPSHNRQSSLSGVANKENNPEVSKLRSDVRSVCCTSESVPLTTADLHQNRFNIWV
jgi:hypothetical protein